MTCHHDREPEPVLVHDTLDGTPEVVALLCPDCGAKVLPLCTEHVWHSLSTWSGDVVLTVCLSCHRTPAPSASVRP